MADGLPIWCEMASLPAWQTVPLHDTHMQVQLHIHEDWNTTPQQYQTPLDSEHRYAGRTPDEWLIINKMREADPNGNITNWVNAFIQTTGFPIIGINTTSGYKPQLLSWESWATSEATRQHYDVDEIHLFEGVGQIPEWVRIFVILARRDTVAWKVALVIPTACMPGTDMETIIANDYVRAGAIFGALDFY